MYFFFLFLPGMPAEEKRVREGLLEAKRRLNDDKAVSYHSSNFWLEPPQKEGL